MNISKNIKQIYLLTSLVFICFNLASQTVTLYTPNGSTIEAFYRDEMSSSDISYYTNLYRNTYPQAEVLANASNTYNCHSYAWNLAEGGSVVCWLNQNPDLHKYWDDNSYMETIEGYAEKIFYYAGDHSAVVSSISGKYESKWGSMPLMRHAPEYGPTIYQMTQRKQYQKALNINISGPSTICSFSNTTYTLNNLPPGATINWTPSSNLSELSPNNEINYIVKAVSSSTSGSGWVQAVISGTGCGDITGRKDFWVGKPRFTLIGEDELEPRIRGVVFIRDNNGNQIIVDSHNDPHITSVNWSYTGPLDYINGDTHKAYYRAGRIGGQGFIYANATNQCGSYENRMYFVVNSGFRISPNPANDYIEAEIMDENFEHSSNNKINVKLFNNRSIPVHTGNSHQKTFRINTSNLPHVLYLLKIIYKGEKYSKQVLIEH